MVPEQKPDQQPEVPWCLQEEMLLEQHQEWQEQERQPVRKMALQLAGC
jgi:hypothetical protein